jgi:hypothetical protein
MSSEVKVRKRWSDEARAAQSERIKKSWEQRRRSQGQKKAWKDADERKKKMSKSMKDAWASCKAKTLFKLGKFRIMWG